MSVKQCARLMGTSEMFIRKGLQQNVLPFGYAVKTSDQWTYYISPAKFTEYTGIVVDGSEY